MTGHSIGIALSRQNDGPITKVNKGNVGRALRIYIPARVADALGLQAGDSIRWAVVTEDGRPIAKFRKVKVVISVSDV